MPLHRVTLPPLEDVIGALDTILAPAEGNR
jgi:hypothetical protein